MSQYVNFFIRSHNDEFLPIETIRTPDWIGHLPWEKIKAITPSILNTWIDDIKVQIDTYHNFITERHELIKIIEACNNSVADKVEEIEDIYESIRGCEEEEATYRQSLRFLYVLSSIIEAADDSKYAEKDEFKYDPAHYLYAGIECAYPTIADIEE